MAEEYILQCWNCLGEFDAIPSVWCSCDPKNPTKLCPYCLQCFCGATEDYKARFWEYAPQTLLNERASLRKIKDRLGELLVRAQVITMEQLVVVLSQQAESGQKLGQLLVSNHLLSSDELSLFLEMQSLALPTKFTDESVDSVSLHRINPEFCLQRKLLPMRVFNSPIRAYLVVAMASPQDTVTIDIVSRKTDMNVVPFFFEEILITQYLESLMPPGSARMLEQETTDYQAMVRKIIVGAIKRHASDIHIEPDVAELNIRYRIDGVLYKVKSPPKKDQGQLLVALKKMTKMDLQNVRFQQSTKILLRHDDQQFQLNVLSFPNPNGESLSIKIVNLSTFLRNLDELGIDEPDLIQIKTNLDSRAGLNLISGPLMNGCSTTQYAMMRYLSESDRKIMSLESPIFSQIRNIHQVEINPSAGFGFVNGLNSIVDSNPEVIFLSDIPDAEVTANVCKIASKCVVVSTFNAASASNTVVQLRELGVSSTLLSQALSLVANQRLIRRICPHCCEKSPISETILVRMGLNKSEAGGLNTYVGVGCKQCNYLGFSGRMAIFEVLRSNPEIVALMADKNAATQEIEKLAIESGMVTLRQRFLDKVNEGLTTIEEFQKARL
jgi:type IV pilus assembly protein PilB